MRKSINNTTCLYNEPMYIYTLHKQTLKILIQKPKKEKQTNKPTDKQEQQTTQNSDYLIHNRESYKRQFNKKKQKKKNYIIW